MVPAINRRSALLIAADLPNWHVKTLIKKAADEQHSSSLLALRGSILYTLNFAKFAVGAAVAGS